MYMLHVSGSNVSLVNHLTVFFRNLNIFFFQFLGSKQRRGEQGSSAGDGGGQTKA
jgi:hypothetical protein